MSNRAVTWVKDQTVGSSNRKLVMLILADYADEAWSCFPSQATIARETELGERTVRRLLGDLEAAGWLRRERRTNATGNRTSDRIYIGPDLASAPGAANRPTRPVGPGAPTGQPEQAYRPTATVPTGQALAGESLGEPPVDPRSTRASAVAAGEQLPLGDVGPQDNPQAVDSPDPMAAPWRLVREAYDARARKPIESRKATARTVRRLLDAGWTEVQLRVALAGSPAWTPTSLQVELARGGGQPRGAPARARALADDPRRQGESRVVNIAEEIRRGR